MDGIRMDLRETGWKHGGLIGFNCLKIGTGGEVY
jgi:hypothetical protein